MLFSFRQNISTFCLQNSDFIGVFSIRPAWDAYNCVDFIEETVNETFSVGDLVTLKIGNDKFVVCEVAENDIWVKGSSSPYPSCIFKKVQ